MLGKVMIGLAGLAFAASAQPLSCTANALPVSIRAEGVTERISDVVVQCTGGSPIAAGQRLPEVNVQLFVSPTINVTNRTFVLVGNDASTDAALLIDDPPSDRQVVCVPTGGAASCPGTARSTANRNVFYGRPAGNNSVRFPAVPIDPPGPGGVRVLRFVNVRVNASQLGTPAGAQASVALVISTSAAGLSPAIALPISNPAPTVAVAQQGFLVSTFAATMNRCAAQNSPLLSSSAGTTSGAAQVRVRVTEGFSNAFKRLSAAVPASFVTIPTPTAQDSPSTNHDSETGFYRLERTAGLADHGTLLNLSPPFLNYTHV